MIPHYKHRKRGYRTRVPLNGCIRTSIYMETRCHQRKSIASYYLVSKPFDCQQRTDNSTNERNRTPCTSHNVHRIGNKSTTIYEEGGGTYRIQTICQSIQ